MTCPRCHSEFGNTDGVCPECGVRLLRNVSGVMKTSAVLIAAGGERGFYRSVQDVPEPLRTQLIETTTSSNSGIIVIADRAGKEQLTQVMARRETTREEKQPDHRPVTEVAVSDQPSLSPITNLPWLAWAGLVAVLGLVAILFAVFYIDWATFSIHW